MKKKISNLIKPIYWTSDWIHKSSNSFLVHVGSKYLYRAIRLTPWLSNLLSEKWKSSDEPATSSAAEGWFPSSTLRDTLAYSAIPQTPMAIQETETWSYEGHLRQSLFILNATKYKEPYKNYSQEKLFDTNNGENPFTEHMQVPSTFTSYRETILSSLLPRLGQISHPSEAASETPTPTALLTF